jgi:ubiquinone/menaquinone biosynthesis C-methylase UbiE
MSEEISKFNEVDDTALPDQFIHFLDTASDFEGVKEGKQKTLELLDLKPGQRILEVGCGTGEDTRMFAEKVYPGGEVVALDKSKEMITAAQRRTKEKSLSIEFRVCDITSLDFDAIFFDRGHVERGLIHMPDPKKAVLEMIRVLRKGGLIVAFEGDLETCVIDSSEPEITRKILRFWCDTFQSPTIGRKLPGIYKKAGLIDVVVKPHTYLFDFNLTEQVLISGTLDRAIEARVVTSHEADRWLSDLIQARDSGTFFYSGTGFIVSGRKP